MFCYETSRVSVRTDIGSGSSFDPLRCNANRCYLDHYRNYLFLAFMSDNGTIAEKHQAKQEMEICERKMKYWERQPHFDARAIIEQKARLHREKTSAC